KTTALRVMLGLVAPGRGAVRLRGEVVSAGGRILRPPEERNLAVGCQDLAPWPHLTVRGDRAFGLAAVGVRGARRAGRLGRRAPRTRAGAIRSGGAARGARREPGDGVRARRARGAGATNRRLIAPPVDC